MNSHILSKFAIIAATIAVNGLMFAGVNYLFNSQTQQRTDWVAGSVWRRPLLCSTKYAITDGVRQIGCRGSHWVRKVG